MEVIHLIFAIFLFLAKAQSPLRTKLKDLTTFEKLLNLIYLCALSVFARNFTNSPRKVYYSK